MTIVAHTTENSISTTTKKYKALVLEINSLTKRKEMLKKEILAYGTIGDLFDVTVSKIETTRFDTASFRKEFSGIYKRFMKVSHNLRISLKHDPK